MNGHEQRAHTTKTAQLASDLETIEGLLHETARRCRDHGLSLDQVGKDLDAHSMALHLLEKKRDATQKQLDTLSGMVLMHTHRTFWSRLNWLLTGR